MPARYLYYPIAKMQSITLRYAELGSKNDVEKCFLSIIKSIGLIY